MRGNDEHTSNDGNESNDEERFKDQLRARKRKSQCVEQLRNDEDEEHAVQNEECGVNAAGSNAVRHQPDSVDANERDSNHQDCGKQDVEGDLEASQHTASSTDNTTEDRAKAAVS